MLIPEMLELEIPFLTKEIISFKLQSFLVKVINQVLRIYLTWYK